MATLTSKGNFLPAMDAQKEVVISYLPLSHVAAHLIDGYMTLYCGGATYCADKDALRGTLVENMKEIRPTHFLGVPRVWEKMQEKMMEVSEDRP